MVVASDKWLGRHKKIYHEDLWSINKISVIPAVPKKSVKSV